MMMEEEAKKKADEERERNVETGIGLCCCNVTELYVGN